MEDKSLTPPYVSYSTFKNTLDVLKEKSIPAVLDASVLSTMSGSTRGALMAGLRFLGLITADDKPTDTFKAIIKGSPEERKPLLKALIEKKYPHSSKAVLDGTSISLKKGFEYEVSEAIRGKCVSFFIGLARDAGIPISTHIDNRVRLKRTSKPKPENPKRKLLPPATSNGGATTEAEDMGGDGISILPITLGPRKVWKIAIEDNFTDDDIMKFTDMIRLAFLKRNS